jgi:hypothetical protein
MTIKIRYRIDTSEVFETDENTFECYTWDTVLSEVKSIEGAGCTVIEIINMEIQ